MKLERVRDLVQSKMLELRPFAGEEMNLPQADNRRDGFIEGERALAAQILSLLDEMPREEQAEHVEPVEEEMVMSLGRT